MRKFQQMIRFACFITFWTIGIVQFNQVTAQHSCGTHATTTQIEYMDKSIRPYAQNYARFRTHATVYVPIKAHIVRPSNGNGGLSISDLVTAINSMNNYYNNANINFYLYENINYIDNDSFYDYDAADENALTGSNDVKNVINIYFVNSATNNGNSLCGYAYFPGGTDRVVMANSCTTNGSTLPHELGHYFALYHTHGKTNNGTTDELVDGSNCANTGDDVCDTPADPNLSGKVSTGCSYTGTDKDANNEAFKPDPNNIMSYSTKACRNKFSQGQYDRISATLTNSRNYLITRTTPSPTIASFTPDNGSTGTMITITGTGFSTTLADNVVKINGVNANVTTSTATQITASVPANATSGLIEVAVNKQLAISNKSFLVPVTVFPYNESFEVASGNWLQSTNDNFDWSGSTGGTSSTNTGPSQAADGNAYMFTEASGHKNKTATLISAPFDLSKLTTPKFAFAYHMYGINMGELKLEISTDNGSNWTSLWSKTGNQGNSWSTQIVDLNSYKTNTARFRFVGTTGSSFRSDMAIDRIQINNSGAFGITSFAPTKASTGATVTITGEGFSTTITSNTVKINGVQATVTSATATELKITVPTGTSTGKISVTTNGSVATSVRNIIVPIATFPYTESFETDLGIWDQNTGDDINWTRHSGSTKSNGTGPGNASDRKFYLYIESSGNGSGFPNKVARLTSGHFQLASLTSPIFSFQYHMYGASMGTLELEASSDGGSWEKIWFQSGDQGNNWQTFNVDLSNYKTGDVRFRFVGTTGGSFTSDIAIDNIQIKNGTASPNPPSIKSFSPASGLVGTVVTIKGDHFDTNAANNNVAFNGVKANVISATKTELKITVPNGATTGKVSITVSGQTSTSSSTFLVLQPLTITSFTPKTGKPGDVVTITGTNFNATTNNNLVQFNGTTATVTFATTTELKVTVPVGVTSGKIRVTTGGQTTTSTDDFAIDPVGLSENLIEGKLSIFPNPVSQIVQLKLEGKAAQQIGIELYNAQGKRVLQGSRKLQKGVVQLNLDGLPTGKYILKIQIKDELISRSIFKK